RRSSDLEISLIAGEAAEPSGSEQQSGVEQPLRCGKGGKQNEGFTFEKGPDESDQVKTGAVVSDQLADVHSRPVPALSNRPGPWLERAPRCTSGAAHAMFFRLHGRADSGPAMDLR